MIEGDVKVEGYGSVVYPPGTTVLTLVVPPGVDSTVLDALLEELRAAGVLVSV